MPCKGNPRALRGLYLIVLVLTGCAAPTISSLNPASGPEHTVVEINGTNQLFSSIQWDGSTVPGHVFGGSFFSVPVGASTGTHDVTLSNSYGTSSPETFTVTSPITWPTPEIKGVQILSVSFGGTRVEGSLLVYGANIDVGATVSIDGTAASTYPVQVLINDFCGGIDPATLGKPAYHYTSMLVSLPSTGRSSTIDLQVENLDGTSSPVFEYTLPSGTSTLDSDGDGLLDDWEENGYDADGDGTIDVDLPAMGLNKFHMDLLVEVDIMKGLANPPSASTWTVVENAFANAPIMNLDGKIGITVHIDRGQGGEFTGGGTTITYKDYISYTSSTSSTNANFYDVKTGNFDTDRLNIFRYAVWANMKTSGSSGEAEDILANDFFVSMDDFSSSYQTDQSKAETFVHELGHTLGFGHGGEATDFRVDEPNHLSIMSYCWQFLSVQLDCITCQACYSSLTPTYSEGMAADLDETDLDENAGVCDNVAVDWDGDGSISTGVSFNINPDDGSASSETLDDYDEWHAIAYDFTVSGSGWGGD